MQAFAKNDTLNVQRFTMPISSEFLRAMYDCNAHIVGKPDEYGEIVWRVFNGSEGIEVKTGQYVGFPSQVKTDFKLLVGDLNQLTEVLIFLD